MATLAKHYKFRLDQPFSRLPKQAQNVILYGSGDDEIKFSYVAEKGEYHWRASFEGLVPMLERRYRETENPSSARSSRRTCRPSRVPPARDGG